MFAISQVFLNALSTSNSVPSPGSLGVKTPGLEGERAPSSFKLGDRDPPLGVPIPFKGDTIPLGGTGILRSSGDAGIISGGRSGT